MAARGQTFAFLVAIAAFLGKLLFGAVHFTLSTRKLPLRLIYGLASVGRRAVAPTSVLNGPLGPHRRWGWARAELADVKLVKTAAGCTVNDVVLAAVAGGFREYLLARGEDVDTTTIRSLVPVSVRTELHRGQLGNHVTAMFAELPVGVADPLERLEVVAHQMIGLKGSGQSVGIESMLAAADFVPATDSTATARLIAAGAVLLGKTNLHEFAAGVTTDNPHWGTCQNPSRSPLPPCSVSVSPLFGGGVSPPASSSASRSP